MSRRVASESSSSYYSPSASPIAGRSVSHSYTMERPGPRRKSSNLLLSNLSRANTVSSADRSHALTSTTEADFPTTNELGTMNSHGSSPDTIPNGASLPNLPSQSLALSHESARQAINKRLQTWTYIKAVHQGDVHYFNSIKLSREGLQAFYQHSSSQATQPASASSANGFAYHQGLGSMALSKRSTRFMVLGLSLGPLLEISNPHDFLRALLATCQEYDQLSDENLIRPRMVSLSA